MLIVLASLLIAVGGGRLQLNVKAAPPSDRFEEVKDWLTLPPGVQLGEVSGVAVDVNGHVLIFHRPGRGFDTTATEKLERPTVLEIDADTGKLIASWGANMFLVPHGITIDGANNVFLADVGLQQVFKFTHDSQLLLALGEPCVGAWDATVAADAAGALYVGTRRADYDTPHTGVLKLDRAWTMVASVGFGQPGDPVFNAVHDLAVGRDGSVYVAETRTKRVVKLRPVR